MELNAVINKLKIGWKHRVKKKYVYAFSVFLLFLIIADLTFPPLTPASYSTVVLDKDGQILSAYLNKDDIWRIKTTRDEVSPYFLKAIVNKEDKYFYYHPGVNLVSVVKAVFNNVISEKKPVGASTITMQVVRMLQPKKRTYAAKATEVLRAIQLELHFSKREILEMYLNLIPYGSNIEGIKTASLLYLQKHPSRLSPAEATLLSVVPNHPQLLKSARNTPELAKYNLRWLNFYARKGIFTEKETKIARSEQVIIKRTALPRLAPHFCNRLKSDDASPYIQTPINLGLQQFVQESVTSYLNKLKSLGLQNAMAMVVDNRTMEVVAYCGSAGYADNPDGGQVDGIQAVRSPGSTLKPFLYGLAVQKGLLSSKTILYDVPSDFDGYTPKNFTDTYQGQISMRDALQLSLNIPAVSLLQEYGVKKYIDDLKRAGFSSVKANEDKLGLSMILGGCGVKMEELVKLYAALANYGNLREPVFYSNQSSKKSQALMDSSAAYIISNILSGIQRPDFPNNFEFTYKLPKIAWKTGTSFGKRDAWAIGYNPNYTVGVWLGNFKGTGVPQLSGAEVATPLLFSLFNQIDQKPAAWYKMPGSLMIKEVCSLTGLPRNSFCETIQYDEFIDKVHYKKKCNHLQSVWVNPAGTFSYCNACLDRSAAVLEKYPYYPPKYLEFLQNNGLPYVRIPPHNPACQLMSRSGELAITSPRNGGSYFVQGNEELELKAATGNTEEEIIWYHNNRYLGKRMMSKSLFIKPDIGKNTVTCTDKRGKSVSVSFEVKAF